VRLVDLPAAWQARSWSAPCDVVVEVADTAAPWNQGVWRIHANERGEAAVAKTTDVADVRLDVQSLGAAYLGSGNLVALMRAGVVQERRAGAVAELWRAMRTDVSPTAAIGF
jgi:predicted acetyltransferase